MLPLGLRHVPDLRPRGRRRVFHFQGVVETVRATADRGAARIAGPPDDRQAPVFVAIAVTGGRGRSDVGPRQQRVHRPGGDRIPDAGQIFVGQRRSHERVVPRVMPPDPVADHGRELAELHAEMPAQPRRDPHRVFLKAQLRPLVGGIEGPVGPRLREQIDVRPPLAVEVKRQARIEQRGAVGENESRGGILEMIVLEVERAAQAQAERVVGGADGEGLVQLVQPRVGAPGERRQRDQNEGEITGRLHSGTEPAAGGRRRKRTSNSVQASSDRVRRRSPRWRRASSRARFRPSPWPGRFSPAAAR